MTRYPGTDHWRIHADLFAVNICDDEGNPVEEGNLCITPLYRKDFPLINYLVGDWARAGYDENGKRIIVAILGRSNDFITHRDGILTTFFMVAPIFAHSNEILQVRLIQKSYDDLVIQAVLDYDYPEECKSEVEERIVSEMNEKLKAPMNMTFDWVDVIEPDANGKLRLIVNEMDK
jgi:phenylacetate-coenzyme A ligase PaaK-like adenylate-forming protein